MKIILDYRVREKLIKYLSNTIEQLEDNRLEYINCKNQIELSYSKFECILYQIFSDSSINDINDQIKIFDIKIKNCNNINYALKLSSIVELFDDEIVFLISIGFKV